MTGKILGNRYEILEQLGGGGMALVYKGQDKLLHRLVTIKILRSEFISDQDFIRRFQQEAQAVARLSHPNIVNIYDVGQEDDIYYLIMEYVNGEDLKTVLKREKNLLFSQAVQIALQVCTALEHAHENNIVHQDIKPHNILITPSGKAKLTDFGIAHDITTTIVKPTGKETIMGTAHYLSPEQVRGEPATPKSDLYALGVTLYEMLTGKVPYTSDNLVAVAVKHLQEEPLPPSQINPLVNSQLEQVILQAMEKDPARRFSSAKEMALYLAKTLPDSGEATRLIPKDEFATRLLSPELNKTKKNLKSRTKNSRLILRWSVMVFIFIVLLGGGAYAFNRYFNIPEIKVPDLKNKNLQEAAVMLRESGLQYTVRQEYDGTVPAGYVIDQDIGPDDPPVKPPREILLTVSLGPELREVPDLYQKTINEARLELIKLDLNLEEPVKEDYHEQVPKDLIFKQTPNPKDKLKKGSKVTVYVSLGPPPLSPDKIGENQEIIVPSLMGLSIEEARNKLVENGLSLDENFQWESSEQYPNGKIISQEPPANSNVAKGTGVKVILSQGPGPLPLDVTIEIPIPDDGINHEVKIEVADAAGTRTVYFGNHPPGGKIEKTVRYYPHGFIRVYRDQKLIEERNTKTIR
ncbi:MAG: Stk1 family PASTA domain-containing Ser/Thr kinase [Peptococcaceae bacterium]